MKKIILIILSVLTITGCSSPKSEVIKYLNKYQNMDNEVVASIYNTIDKENLSIDNKEIYYRVFEKQYKDLSFKIVNEDTQNEKSIITTRVSVYDLYQNQMDTTDYLRNNEEYFNDENGNYDINKYYNYKLNNMLLETRRIDYNIDFYLYKINNKWILTSLTQSDLEKISGVYNNLY